MLVVARRINSQLPEVALIDVGQDIVGPAAGLAFPESLIGVAHPFRFPTARRQKTVCRFVVEKRLGDLGEIVLALGTSAGLAGRIHGRQQQADQDPDDGDDY